MLHGSVWLCAFGFQHFAGARIGVTVEHDRLDIAPNALKTREGVIDRRGFIATMHHAIGALGVAALVAVIGPIGLVN